jgi:hypothetical protein
MQRCKALTERALVQDDILDLVGEVGAAGAVDHVALHVGGLLALGAAGEEDLGVHHLLWVGRQRMRVSISQSLLVQLDAGCS